MAAQLMQIVEVLGGIKGTLDAGNMSDETFAQVMKTLVESTGTAWNVIKTWFDGHETKATETMAPRRLVCYDHGHWVGA